jgi:hypothetical protein
VCGSGDGTDARTAALLVLAVHLAIIVFNVAGLVLIPLGGWRGWRFVRRRDLRILHLLSLTVVAIQALLGRACFLTILQSRLEGDGGRPPPLIAHWIDRLVYWPLPLAFFTALYVAVWVYVLALWYLVPPVRPKPPPR